MSNLKFTNKSDHNLRGLYPWLRRVIQSTIAAEGMDSNRFELTVAFTSDNEIQRLNETYRQISSPTDVLAFPANDLDPETGREYLGDIVISMDQVKKQHEEFGDLEKDILSLLVTHGTLHLLGYDHATRVEKIEMWRRQDSILSQFQVIVHIPE